jgi:hypothetical protein
MQKWRNLAYRFWFRPTTISQNFAEWSWCRIRGKVQWKSDREFCDLSRKNKYACIRPTVQELRSLEFGEGVSSGQIKLYTQIWTLSLYPKEIGKNSTYKGPREFYKPSSDGWNSEFWSQTKKLWPVEVERYYKIQFSLRVNFKFLLICFPKFILFMKMHMHPHDTCWSYTFLTKRNVCQLYKAYVKSLANHTHPWSQFYRI